MVADRLADSYVSLAEAEEYFAGRLGTEAWVVADTNAKECALLMALRELERLRWHGEKMSAEQVRCWPRRNAPGVMAGVVPVTICAAQCEEALAWLQPALTRRRLLRDAGVTSAQVDTVREDYAPGGVEALLSPTARALLTGWVRLGAVLVTEGRR